MANSFLTRLTAFGSSLLTQLSPHCFSFKITQVTEFIGTSVRQKGLHVSCITWEKPEGGSQTCTIPAGNSETHQVSTPRL